MEHSINEEAVWGKLSEIDKKIEKILSQSEKQNQVEPISREEPSEVTKEEVENTVKKYSQGLGKFITEIYNKRSDQLEEIEKALIGVYLKIGAIPPPEKISLEPILDLLRKPKKVNVCGFEFLKTSVIIFVLAVFSFLSLTVNIKQTNDYRMIKSKYTEQSVYIMQIREELDMLKEQNTAKIKEKKK